MRKWYTDRPTVSGRQDERVAVTTVALLGAGGKMGLRLTENLKKSDYAVRHVEISEQGRAALADVGVETGSCE